jgi:nucleoid-associated protein EbfC
MFKGLGQLGSILKNATEIQGRIQEMQENLKRHKYSGSAGGGMVTVEMNGQHQLMSCRIEESLFASGDREIIEDLVVTACNQALDKAREGAAAEMAKVTGGIGMPGLEEALAKLGNGPGA